MNSRSIDMMTATFTYTNIVPQFADLNQEAWRLAEIAIREFVQTKNCNLDKTYLLTGTVPSEMYIGYGDDYIDERDNDIPKSTHPELCRKGYFFCSTKYKVNIPAYIWTAGACQDKDGNCNTFSVLAKNDGHENSVGFYSLATLQKFLGANSLKLSTCWMNAKLDKNDPQNKRLRAIQKDQTLTKRSFMDPAVKLFPGCAKGNADRSAEFVQYFKDKGWAHFLHGYIPTYVEKKRQQLLTNIEHSKAKFPGQADVLTLLDTIIKAVRGLDSIVDSDLTAQPLSNCDYD